MSALLSSMGFSFLPNIVSGWILTTWYSLTTRAGDRIPQRGTQRYSRHYKRVHIFIISICLLYTVIDAYYHLQRSPNFYELLSVPPSVNEKTLKSRFRRLTIIFHPDKAGNDGADHFVMLKQAYDTLSEPSKRFAYERLGPDVLDWKHCVTSYDFLVHGGTQLLPWYLGSLLFLVILTVLGKFEFGRYWRYLIFFSLWMFEAAVITRPYIFFEWLPLAKTLLPFEQLILARKVVLISFIAFSRLGPILRLGPVTTSDKSLQQSSEKLLQLVEYIDSEVNKVMTEEYMPFDYKSKTCKYLERTMGEWMEEQAIRNGLGVQDAMGKAIAKSKGMSCQEQMEQNEFSVAQ